MPKKTSNVKKEPVGRYIDLKTDFGFKLVFGTKEYLIHFLNSVLKIKGGIKEILYRSTERKGISKDDRSTFYDLHCTTGTGERVIVEMQHRRQKHYRDRALYYLSLSIAEQGRKGKWDFELTPVYSVNIVDFKLPGKKKTGEYKYEVHKFMDKITVAFLELPYFTKKVHELKTDVERWMYIIKHLPEMSELPEELRTEVFEKLFLEAEIANMSKEERNNYNISLKNYIDMTSLLNEVEESRTKLAEKDKTIAIQAKEIAELRRRLGINASAPRSSVTSRRKAVHA
jgi:predicted transposase/invertase (TIGR01784 family)